MESGCDTDGTELDLLCPIPPPPQTHINALALHWSAVVGSDTDPWPLTLYWSGSSSAVISTNMDLRTGYDNI